MKIKTYLLISYFVVMVLPLLSLYILFASVTSYQSDQKVEEYYDAYAEIQDITAVLDDPKWFDLKSDKQAINELAREDLAIYLVNAEGVKVYHSNPDLSFQGVLNKEQLYRDLYEVKESLKAYTYRAPVFDGEELAGFYDIEIARDALIGTVIKRSWIVIGLFFASFILVYAAISYFVNKRVTSRLYGLREEITAFASGKMYPETSIKKDEIGELKTHFYSMRKQIAEGQEAIKKEQEEKEFMVAAISHDLKTPLTSIKAYAELLNESKSLSKVDQATYQRIIVDKSDFIKQMLDDLMSYSLLQSSDYKMEVVDVEGQEFFDMLVSGYDALCDQNNVVLNTYSDAPGEYKVNPQQLIRVADNLMGNAIKHTPEQGGIWLLALAGSAFPEDLLFDYVKSQYVFNLDSNAYLIVQNEGTGIEESEMSQLFQPLYQIDQARSKQGDTRGTGLGLSITKQIMEKHDGDVTVVSKAGQGACFICRIPKKEKES